MKRLLLATFLAIMAVCVSGCVSLVSEQEYQALAKAYSQTPSYQQPDPPVMANWLDTIAWPAAMRAEPKIGEQLQALRITIDTAVSEDTRRLCLADELGFSYTRRSQAHIGFCPIGLSFAANISAFSWLIAYEQAMGTGLSHLEPLAQSFGEASENDAREARANLLAGRGQPRCSTMFRYFLWKQHKVMPHLCEMYLQDASTISAYTLWWADKASPDNQSEKRKTLPLLFAYRSSIDSLLSMLRFVVLHELGHHQLGHLKELSTPRDQQEDVADRYAMDILPADDLFPIFNMFTYMVNIAPQGAAHKRRAFVVVDRMIGMFTLERTEQLGLVERLAVTQLSGGSPADIFFPAKVHAQMHLYLTRLFSSIR